MLLAPEMEPQGTLRTSVLPGTHGSPPHSCRTLCLVARGLPRAATHKDCLPIFPPDAARRLGHFREPGRPEGHALALKARGRGAPGARVQLCPPGGLERSARGAGAAATAQASEQGPVAAPALHARFKPAARVSFCGSACFLHAKS
ncbi:hypothetical protein R6Z07F_003584 [Ovis aries]